MRIVIPILFVLGFLVIGCDSILGEIEEVETGIRCNEISIAGAMLGDDVDTSISEICKDTCLRNVMKYSPDYRCHATSLKLICSCIVTPERKEQLKILKEREETKELNKKCDAICQPECEVGFEKSGAKIGEFFDLAVSIESRNDFYCNCKCVNKGLFHATAIKR